MTLITARPTSEHRTSSAAAPAGPAAPPPHYPPEIKAICKDVLQEATKEGFRALPEWSSLLSITFGFCVRGCS